MGTTKNRQDTMSRLKKSAMPSIPSMPVMTQIPSIPQELEPENIRTEKIRISMLPDMPPPPPNYEEPEEEHDEMLNIVQNPRQKIRMSMLPDLPSLDIPDIPDISSTRDREDSTLPELLENPENRMSLLPEFSEMDLPPPPVLPGKIDMDELPDLPDTVQSENLGNPGKPVDKRCTIMREFDAIDDAFGDILTDLNTELN